jgi:peptide/nickel transport system substrate-binding protein
MMSDEIDRIVQQLARRNVQMSRRHLLRIMGNTGVGIAGLAALVGCGSDNKSSPAAAGGTSSSATSPSGAASGTTSSSAGLASTGMGSPSASGSASPSAGSSGGVGQTIPAKYQKGGTLIVANEAELNDNDPQKYNGTHAGRTLRNIFDPLVTIYNDSSQLTGGLAESWDISEDGLTYTFKLRPNLVFQDNTPITADNVAFTFLRILDDNNEWNKKTGPFPGAKFEFPYVIPDQIKAVDPLTLRFQLSQPDATFLDNLTWAGSGIISPTALQKYGMDFTSHPVGAGPFQFSAWDKGTSFTIERFDKYWGGAPFLDKVIFKPVIEDAARLVQLQAGKVDLVAALAPQFIAQVKSNPDLVIHQTQGIHIWWVTLNLHEKPFSDVRVRQAMNYAIDKDTIIKTILGGAAVPSHSFAFPNTPAYTEDLQQYPYDPDKAKDLLSQAGFPDGFTTTYLIPQSGSGMVAPTEIATVMQSQLAKVGVTVKIQTLEWTSYLSAYLAGLDKYSSGPVGMAQLSYMIPQPDPGMYAYDALGSKGSINAGYYANDQVDQLLLKAKGTTDPDARVPLYQQAEKLVAQDAPWIFMFHAFNVVAAHKKVQNIVLNPDFNILHLERVWIQQ